MTTQASSGTTTRDVLIRSDQAGVTIGERSYLQVCSLHFATGTETG